MLILSRVCAEFRDGSGAVLFSVTPNRRLTFIEAPEAICMDPLFRLLVEEGSLEAAVHPSAQAVKALEQDPMKGADPAGRRTPAPRRAASRPAAAGKGPAAEKAPKASSGNPGCPGAAAEASEKGS